MECLSLLSRLLHLLLLGKFLILLGSLNRAHLSLSGLYRLLDLLDLLLGEAWRVELLESLLDLSAELLEQKLALLLDLLLDGLDFRLLKTLSLGHRWRLGWLGGKAAAG